jgi:hypothetical protein
MLLPSSGSKCARWVSFMYIRFMFRKSHGGVKAGGLSGPARTVDQEICAGSELTV